MAATASCGGDNLLLPKDGEPAQITIMGGDNQNGTVGQPLGDSLVVKVSDPSGRPVEGVEVVFVAPAGGVVAPSDTVHTDAGGLAQVAYTLSTTAGDQMVEARATPIVSPSASSITFHTIATPEDAQTLVQAAGDGQAAQTSTALPESLAVQAVDRFGNGVAGVEVVWQTSGGLAVSPESVVTDAGGRAATLCTLGDRPGSYGLSAKAELEGSPVLFTATAVAPPSPELIIVTEPSATAAAGVPLEQQPKLQLQDPFGAPLAREGVSVTVQVATGGGSVGGKTTAKSDANGVVSFEDLEVRGETGERTLIFAAQGFTPVTSASINVGAGPPAASHTSASIPDGTAGATTTLRIHLADEFDNPITGAANRLSVSIVGANPGGGLPVTDQGGGDYSAQYVPVHTGADEVRVELAGNPLPGAPYRTNVAPGAPDAAHTTADVSRTNNVFTILTVLVTVRDGQGNPVGHGGDRVEVNVNGQDVTSALRDHGDGTYGFSIFAFANQFSVVITLNGQPIQGSPFTPVIR
ncbi:MAG TPA: filamin/ABP280 repeat domain-containing protein [Gemmatimonadales bacterium]|nr:filamin/ABP280 repeat domain-containing protein [Gemmatimonadales bacterium]